MATMHSKSRSLFFLLIAFQLYSQAFGQSVINIGAKLTALDNLDNLYVLTNDGVLQQYAPDGRMLHTYSNKTFGEVAAIDVSNPMKIIVFYRDYLKVLYLDNNLNPNGDPIDLQSLGFNFITNVASANENGLWLFNAQTNEVVKLDQYLQVIAQSGNLLANLAAMVKPTQMLFYNNQLLVNDPQLGIMVKSKLLTCKPKRQAIWNCLPFKDLMLK